MRRSRIALVMSVAIIAATGLLVGGLAVEAVSDEKPVASQRMDLPIDPAAQQKLHRMTDPVQDWVESGAPEAEGYAGTYIDAPNLRADMWWKGEVPARARELIDVNSTPGLRVRLLPAPYSRADIRHSIDVFTKKAPEGTWNSVGPKEDGTAISVTYDRTGAARAVRGTPTPGAYERWAEEIAGIPVTATLSGAIVNTSGRRSADHSPYYAGAELRSPKPSFCSTAFSGFRDHARVVLTAAHCGNGKYYTGNGDYLGTLDYAGSGIDIAMIGTGAGQGDAHLYDGGWSDGSGSSRRFYGPGRNNAGDIVLTSGAMSGWHDNLRITDVDKETSNEDGEHVKPVDFAAPAGGERRVAVAKGDSGGPVVANPQGSDNAMEARGVIIGGADTMTCPAGSTAWDSTTCFSHVVYVPMGQIVSQMNFSMS
ncbi:trypsin-like serine protease [Kitasatospora sp. NPDC058162]|uniref:trypsin-like serine protease n=1 Tax=Kitasatospora sp. NPDC058162 TaxID=3346362 RepID=UPI0036D994F9